MIGFSEKFGVVPTRANAPVVMYTTAWCVDCWRAKQVMDSMKVEYTEIDISGDEEATELVVRLNRGFCSVPTLVFPDGSVMTEPRTTALVAKLQSLL
jgi:mycoredoxin